MMDKAKVYFVSREHIAKMARDAWLLGVRWFWMSKDILVFADEEVSVFIPEDMDLSDPIFDGI